MVTVSTRRGKHTRGAIPCSQRGIDTTQMKEAATATWNDLPTPTTPEVLGTFHGSKEAMTIYYAGTPDKSSREYKNMRDRIGRYLRGVRTPDREMKELFKQRIQSKRNLRVTIGGCVHVSDEYYYKEPTTRDIPAAMVHDFLQAAMESNSEGYALWNGVYMGVPGTRDNTFTWLDNTRVIMSFS